MFSMGSGSDNTGSCHRSCSCKTKKRDKCLFCGRSRGGRGAGGRALLCHSPVAEETILDHFDDEGSCVFFAQTGVEPLPEWENGSSATREDRLRRSVPITRTRRTHLSSLIVCPLKQGRPVSSMSVTKETTASM